MENERWSYEDEQEARWESTHEWPVSLGTFKPIDINEVEE